jgi:hypothetical protein
MAGPPSTQPGRAFAWSHGRFGGTCLTEINRGFEIDRFHDIAAVTARRDG